MQLVLERANEQAYELEAEKLKCVRKEDFEGAKKIRDELVGLRKRVTDLASKFYDPEGSIKMYKSDVALRQRMEEVS
jgi:hypothetical protein